MGWAEVNTRAPGRRKACCVPATVFDSVGLGRGLKICLPNKFPSHVDDICPGTTLWEPLCQSLIPPTEIYGYLGGR